MKTVNTISINGTVHAVPDGISQADLVKLSGTLLLLQRIDYCCCNEYRKSFHHLEADRASVRFGTLEVYANQAEARAAKDAYNETLPAKEATV
jgi:hypothetical protein